MNAQCTYSDFVTKSKCRECYRRFNMIQAPCCLDLCGEHEKCKGCKRGIYSEEYKRWRNAHEAKCKLLCRKN